MNYVIGIDIGTTNIKAVLFNTEGKSICSASEYYPTEHTTSGRAEQNPLDWYDGTVKAVRRIISLGEVSPSEVLCICLDGHIRSIAFFDKHFNILYPGIIWSDIRSQTIAKRINARMENDLMRVCGNKAAANFAVSNIEWLKQNEPETWSKTTFLANPKDYVIYRMTGNFVSDASNQAGTLLLDLDHKKWSDCLLNTLGIPKTMLPEIVYSTDIAGGLTKEAASDMGLSAGLPVVTGGGDNDTAALGAGVYEAGIVSVSLGTAGIILTPLDKPIRQMTPALDVFPHILSDKWYAMGMIKAAGFAVDWLKGQYAELCSEPVSTEKWLSQIGFSADSFIPGNDGLFCFPYFQGRGNPQKDASVKGVFWGVSSGHSGRHFAQATMEGVSYCIKQCIDAIESQIPIKTVVCCGGGSRNSGWLQIIASVLNRPVMRSGGNSEGALGAAVLGAVAMGVYPSIEGACKRFICHEEVIPPNPLYADLYAELFARFCCLSDRLWPE